MNTNFFAIEISSATHDAEQLKAMRQAIMPRAICKPCAALLAMLSCIFSHPTLGASRQAAAEAI